jgi:hypothetical protein
MPPPIADILHRGLVLSLAGLAGYGIFLGFAVHRETIEKGRRMYCFFFIFLSSFLRSVFDVSIQRSVSHAMQRVRSSRPHCPILLDHDSEGP